MMINYSKKLVAVIFFCFISLFNADASEAAYRSSWIQLDRVDNTDFHASVAPRIASARIKLKGLDDPSNITAFGLRITATNNASRREESLLAEFPNLLYSAYNVSEDRPETEDVSGSQIIAIPDLFRGDAVSGESKKHKVCSFCFWLASKPYTEGWGLEGEIDSDATVIASGNALEMSKITSFGQRRDSLQSVLHCEQLFLYTLLTDRRVLRNMFDKILSCPETARFFDANHINPRFTLEICTYNDMCTRCFSTCFHLHRELSCAINEEFLKKISANAFLKTSLTRTFRIPIPLRINISSFRPFRLDAAMTRNGAPRLLSDYAQYFRFVPHVGYADNRMIVQLFNPYIGQHILQNRFVHLIQSINLLGSERDAGMTAADITDISRKLDAIRPAPDILRKIADTLFSCKGIMRYAVIDRSLLPLAVMLANVIRPVPNEDFIRNLFFANNLIDQGFATTELTRLSEANAVLRGKIQEDSAFVQKFVLPMPQMLLESKLGEFIPLFQETVRFSTTIHPAAFNLLCQNVLLQKVFPVISSVPDPKFQDIVLPFVIMLAQLPHVEPPVLEEIGQHLRNMFAIYSTSEVTNPADIHRYVEQLRKLDRSTASIGATILDKNMLLGAIKLSELTRIAQHKQYDFGNILQISQDLANNFKKLHEGIAKYIKNTVATVQNNIASIKKINYSTQIQQIEDLLRSINPA